MPFLSGGYGQRSAIAAVSAGDRDRAVGGSMGKVILRGIGKLCCRGSSVPGGVTPEAAFCHGSGVHSRHRGGDRRLFPGFLQVDMCGKMYVLLFFKPSCEQFCSVS